MCVTSDPTCPLVQKKVNWWEGSTSPQISWLPSLLSCSKKTLVTRDSTAALHPLRVLIIHSRKAAATSFIPLLPLTPLVQDCFLFLSCDPWFSYYQGEILPFKKKKTTKDCSLLHGPAQTNHKQVQSPGPPVPLLLPLTRGRLLLHRQKVSFCLLWESVFSGCSKLQKVHPSGTWV